MTGFALTIGGKAAATRNTFDVLNPAPFSVANYVNASLFLQAHGKDHHLIHQHLKSVCGQLLSTREEVAYNFGTRQRTDYVCKEQRQAVSISNQHMTGVQPVYRLKPML